MKGSKLMAAMVKRQEQPVERREGVRQRLLMRVAKLRCGSGEYPCVMHDVSETGTRLRMFGGHPVDTHMYLEMANGELFALERRWIEGDYAGFRFSSAIDVEDLILEPTDGARRPVRLRIGTEAHVIVDGVRRVANLVDLSRQGACIDPGTPFPVGSTLKLELPGHAPRFGYVCWRRHNRHGVAFQESFTFEQLSQLAIALQPFGGKALAPIDPVRFAKSA